MLGDKCRKFMADKKMADSKIKSICQHARILYETAASYIYNKLPLRNELLKHAEVFDLSMLSTKSIWGAEPSMSNGWSAGGVPWTTDRSSPGKPPVWVWCWDTVGAGWADQRDLREAQVSHHCQTCPICATYSTQQCVLWACLFPCEEDPFWIQTYHGNRHALSYLCYERKSWWGVLWWEFFKRRNTEG